MGQMHFHVPAAATSFFEGCDWPAAYLCGIEGIPWETHNQFRENRLTLSRGVATSAKLLITCRIPEIGDRLLTSCSLRCVEQPHRLLVELARGSCYRVRVQADIWQRGGLSVTDWFHERLNEGTERLIDAMQSSADDYESQESVDSAIRSISVLEQAADELGRLFATQSIAFRRSRENRLSTMLAVSLDPPEPASWSDGPAAVDMATADELNVSAKRIDLESSDHGIDPPASSSNDGSMTLLTQSFNAVAIRIRWGDLEDDSGRVDYAPVNRSLDACASGGFKVIGGPLVEPHRGGLPTWLTLMEDDIEKIVASTVQFVEQTVTQLRGRVHLWNAVSGFNLAGPLRLDDEEIMRLSLSSLQAVRRCDPNTPVIFSLDQPCGEYLSRDQNGISPLHFADALLRSGLGLAGVGLNFRFSDRPDATFPRSAIEFAQIIDRWATLGAPLLVQMSVSNHLAAEHFNDTSRGDSAPPDAQLKRAEPLIHTLLAKPNVHAIVWEHWSDQSDRHDPLNATGLLDREGHSRPLLNSFAEIRDQWLM